MTHPRLDGHTDALTEADEWTRKYQASIRRRIDRGVRARLGLINEAQHHLGERPELHRLDATGIRRAVILELAPEARLDGKTKAEIHARYDAEIERAGETAPDRTGLRGAELYRHRLLRQGRTDADWDESKHFRGQHGKFSSRPGGGAGVAEGRKVARKKPGPPAPQQASMVISGDPELDRILTGQAPTASDQPAPAQGKEEHWVDDPHANAILNAANRRQHDAEIQAAYAYKPGDHPPQAPSRPGRQTYKLSLAASQVGGWHKYENDKGHTECVTFVQKTAGLPNTSQWRPGAHVIDSKIQPGTVIATFDKSGKYPPDSQMKHGKHAAVFLYQDSNGIYVLDQWDDDPAHPGKGGGQVKPRLIPYTKNPKNLTADLSSYYVVETDPPSPPAPGPVNRRARR